MLTLDYIKNNGKVFDLTTNPEAHALFDRISIVIDTINRENYDNLDFYLRNRLIPLRNDIIALSNELSWINMAVMPKKFIGKFSPSFETPVSISVHPNKIITKFLSLTSTAEFYSKTIKKYQEQKEE